LIQRAGAIAITGGLQTSPMDVLDAHAFTLPISLEIEKHLFRAAIHIATLPPEHPLHTPAKKCATKMVKRHKSLLHKLMQAFNINPSLFKTISTTGGNPAWAHICPFKLDIANNKDASIMANTEGNEKVKIYSDGLAQNGKVGAAAVLIRLGKKPCMLHYHLGTTEHHTVFEAKLVGLILGLHLIKTEKTSRTTFTLGADNMAAILAVATPSNRSGHHLVHTFINAATNLKKKSSKTKYLLTIRWTAGHVNIEGNELADKEVKLAAEGLTSAADLLLRLLKKPLKLNKSAAKQHFNVKLKSL